MPSNLALVRGVRARARISRVVERFQFNAAATPQKIQLMLTKFGPDSGIQNPVTEEQLNYLADSDPTATGNYFQYLVNQFRAGNIKMPEDSSILRDALKLYDKVKRSTIFTGKKDIFQYKDVGDLYEDLEPFLEKADLSTEQMKKEDLGGVETVLRGAGFVWYKITEPKAACTMGSGTKWCTVPNEETARSYIQRGPLYIMHENERPVFQFHFAGEEYNDTMNRPISEDHYGYQLLKKKYHPYKEKINALITKLNP